VVQVEAEHAVHQILLVPKCKTRDKILNFDNNLLVIVSELKAEYPDYESILSERNQPDQMLSYLKKNPSIVQQYLNQELNTRSPFNYSP